MARTLNDLMTPDPVTLPTTATLTEAAKLMAEQEIGDVVVLGDSSDVCGVVTDRDIVVRAIAENLPPKSTTLESVATREMIMVEQSATTDEALQAMRERGVRRLLVCDADRKLVGIVSLSDLAMLPTSTSA